MALVGTGCVVIPVTSPTPVAQKGILDDDTLESLLGLDEDAVIERIGMPDYAGPRGDSSLLVYEGLKTYSTDIAWFVAAGYTGGGGVAEGAGGKTEVFYCHVIELDKSRVVEDYDVIPMPAAGLSKRDSNDSRFSPVDSCLEVVWEPSERDLVSTAPQLAETEPVRAETAAVIEVAGVERSVAAVEAMAEDGDNAAAYALYQHYSGEPGRIEDAWSWLCVAANRGDAEAQAETGYWFRSSVWRLSRDHRLESITLLGVGPNDRVAYMWYTLASENGSADALEARQLLATEMTPGEIAEAEALARDWKPLVCPRPVT